MSTQTFEQAVDAAMLATQLSSEFTPSLAQRSAALQPVVDRMLAMDKASARRWVVASFRGAGSWGALAVRMYREQCPVDIDATNAAELTLHHFCADASELQLPPGVWPQMLTTDLGNQRPFIHERVDADGAHVYHQESGCLWLTVLND